MGGGESSQGDSKLVSEESGFRGAKKSTDEEKIQQKYSSEGVVKWVERK